MSASQPIPRQALTLREERQKNETWRHPFATHWDWQGPYQQKGLNNNGSTCYRNATWQMLVHIPAFVKWIYFYHEQHIPSGSTGSVPVCRQGRKNSECKICLVYNVVNGYWGGSNLQKAITELEREIHRDWDNGSHTGQQDMAEFWEEVLRQLTEQTMLQFQSDLTDLFKISIAEVRRCTSGQCPTNIQSYDMAWLRLGWSQERKGGQHLQQLINKTFDPSKLDKQCSQCRSPQTTSQMLGHPPETLFITFNRVQYSSSSALDHSHIQFGQDVIIGSEYMDSRVKHDHNAEYRLIGVVAHHGESSLSGHYFSYVRGAEDRWFCVDDESVNYAGEEGSGSFGDMIDWEYDGKHSLGEVVYALVYTRTPSTPDSDALHIAQQDRAKRKAASPAPPEERGEEEAEYPVDSERETRKRARVMEQDLEKMTTERTDWNEQLQNRPPPEETMSKIKSLKKRLQEAMIIDLRESEREQKQRLQNERTGHQNMMNEMQNTLNELRTQLRESQAREAASSQTLAELEREVTDLRRTQARLDRLGEQVPADGELDLTFTDSKNKTLYRAMMRGRVTQINDRMLVAGGNMTLSWLEMRNSGDISADGKLELRFTQQQPYRETMRAMIEGKLVDMRQRERLGSPSNAKILARSVLNTIRRTPPTIANRFEVYNRERREIEQRLREMEQHGDREDPQFNVKRENMARQVRTLTTLEEKEKEKKEREKRDKKGRRGKK